MTDKKNSPGPGFNLLRVAPLRWLILSRAFPYVFQFALLVVFIGLAVMAWGHFAPAGVKAKLFAKCNFVTLLIWGLWWPAMVLVALLLGRLWCAICPLELVANCSERLGKRLGVKQVALGQGLSAGAMVVFLFAVLQLCVPGAQLHRTPAYTSIFLWGLLLLAVLTSIFIRDRAFCRGFCPVAALLNVYGRGGMLAVRAGSAENCEACATRDCVASEHRDSLDARSCPSLLNPTKLNSNSDCLLCGQCLKACPSGNMQLLLRRPFHGADEREGTTSWPLTLFVILVSGFVTYELCSEWAAAESIFLAVPGWVSERLHAGSLAGWVQGMWTVLLVPLLLWGVLGILTRVLGGAASIGEAWRRLALPMAVIVAAGHLAKGIAKSSSWAGFLPLSLKEPLGTQTALAMQAKAMAQPALLLSKPLVSWLCLVLAGIAIYYSFREAKLADPQAYRARLMPIALYGGLLLFLIQGWTF